MDLVLQFGFLPRNELQSPGGPGPRWRPERGASGRHRRPQPGHRLVEQFAAAAAQADRGEREQQRHEHGLRLRQSAAGVVVVVVQETADLAASADAAGGANLLPGRERRRGPPGPAAQGKRNLYSTKT